VKRLEWDLRRRAERNQALVGVYNVACVCSEIRFVNLKLLVPDSDFRLVLNVVCFLLGDSPASVV
jgi:hypothetical protein